MAEKRRVPVITSANGELPPGWEQAEPADPYDTPERRALLEILLSFRERLRPIGDCPSFHHALWRQMLAPIIHAPLDHISSARMSLSCEFTKTAYNDSPLERLCRQPMAVLLTCHLIY